MLKIKVLQEIAFAKENHGTYFVHVFARRGCINVFSRRGTGFDRRAKSFPYLSGARPLMKTMYVVKELDLSFSKT